MDGVIGSFDLVYVESLCYCCWSPPHVDCCVCDCGELVTGWGCEGCGLHAEAAESEGRVICVSCDCVHNLCCLQW